MKENTISIEILPDGKTLKITTGTFSSAVHSTAEAVMRAIEEDLGGDSMRVSNGLAPAHHHDHEGHRHGH